MIRRTKVARQSITQGVLNELMGIAESDGFSPVRCQLPKYDD